MKGGFLFIDICNIDSKRSQFVIGLQRVPNNNPLLGLRHCTAFNLKSLHSKV